MGKKNGQKELDELELRGAPAEQESQQEPAPEGAPQESAADITARLKAAVFKAHSGEAVAAVEIEIGGLRFKPKFIQEDKRFPGARARHGLMSVRWALRWRDDGDYLVADGEPPAWGSEGYAELFAQDEAELLRDTWPAWCRAGIELAQVRAAPEPWFETWCY